MYPSCKQSRKRRRGREREIGVNFGGIDDSSSVPTVAMVSSYSSFSCLVSSPSCQEFWVMNEIIPDTNQRYLPISSAVCVRYIPGLCGTGGAFPIDPEPADPVIDDPGPPIPCAEEYVPACIPKGIMKYQSVILTIASNCKGTLLHFHGKLMKMFH